MKHSRMSAQSSYRQMLKAGMSRFLPAPLFPMAIAERTFAGPVDSSLSLRSSWRGIRSQRSATASLRPAMSWGTCFPLADASARPIKDLPRPYAHVEPACRLPAGEAGPGRADGTVYLWPERFQKKTLAPLALRLEPIRITTRSRVVTKTRWLQGRPTTPYLGGMARRPDAADACFRRNPKGRTVFCPMPALLGLDDPSGSSSPSRLGLGQNPTRRGPCSDPDRLLIVLERKGKKMYLLTDLSAEQLSEVQAARLYEMRWGVELFYRSMKQTLSHRKMLSHAPGQARAELSWTLVGLQLLGLMSVSEIIQSGKDPLSWSVALSLRVVRPAMGDRKPRRSCRGGFLGALSRAVKDDDKRSSIKEARNWPHKKKDKPPGAPKLRKANGTEIERARTIKATTMAA